MKKWLMLVVLLFGLGCAAAGIYLFYLKPHMDAEAVDTNASRESVAEPPLPTLSLTPALEARPEVMDFYVSAVSLGVREQPDLSAYVDLNNLLYRGQRVHLLEKQSGWGRISDYYVYQEGGPEVAEWIPLDGLSVEAPIITPQERSKTVAGYIGASDDFGLYQEQFVTSTDRLLNDGHCAPQDFAELGGWVRSVTYASQPVYFIYCGGLNQRNKIYLNAQTGQIFYR